MLQIATLLSCQVRFSAVLRTAPPAKNVVAGERSEVMPRDEGTTQPGATQMGAGRRDNWLAAHVGPR